MRTPILEQHAGVYVVREDLYPGGTKARYMPLLFAEHEELVYATPACGGAQFAMATVGAQLGKRVTLFVARRQCPHARTLQARRLGAKVVEVAPGYLTCVTKRARQYASTAAGAFLVPFGFDVPGCIDVLAGAARALTIAPDEVWCAAGSGTLARALALAWPNARRHVVEVGRALAAAEVSGATIHKYPRPFMELAKRPAPFSADLNYDAKAWEVCAALHGSGRVLFWNVAGNVYEKITPRPAGATAETANRDQSMTAQRTGSAA